MIGTQMDEVPQACRAFEFLERGAVVEVEHARETSAFLDLEPDSSLKVIAAPGKPFADLP